MTRTQKLAMLSLGGRSTLFYLRQLNELYQNQHGRDAICPLLLKKTDFDKVNSLLPDQFSPLEEIVDGHLQSLNGVEKILVPNITLHETIDRMSLQSHQVQKIIHPVKLVAQQLSDEACNKITLIGSHYTMNSDYLTDYLNQHNIDVMLPSSDDQQAIDQFRKKVYSFTETKNDADGYLALLESYKKESKIVIACTELSLTLPGADANTFDMARLQIEDAMTLYQTA